MVSGELPAAARRRLRLALRKAREAKGFTQGQVAEALDWSLSKVQRIESGEVTVSRSDLVATLDLLDVTDKKKIEQLLQLAKASRVKGWWDDSRYREHLTHSLFQLVQFELEASAIRVFHPTLIPGLLQTRAYADQVLDFWRDEMTDVQREVRLEVRLRRREHVLDRPDPPDYLVVLDESVLHRQVGGPKVTAEQLHTLLEIMKNPKVIVRMLPFEESAPLVMLNHFIILDLGDEENAIVYREGQLADYLEQASSTIEIYRRRFEQLWKVARSPDETAKFVADRASALLTPSSRRRRGGS